MSEVKRERLLGKVDSTFLGVEDHGIMSFMIRFDFGTIHQGFGNYALDNWIEEKKKRIGTASGMDAIMQILKVFNVDSWEKIRGKICWVEKENGMIVAIEAPEFEGGHGFSIKDWQKEWWPEK